MSFNEVEWEKVLKDGDQATVEEPTSDHDEGSGKGGLSWGLRCLSKILVAAKGAATFQVVEFIKKQYVVNAMRYNCTLLTISQPWRDETYLRCGRDRDREDFSSPGNHR
jgi:hypothetical protein